MNPAIIRYGVPGLFAAGIAFAIRYLFADLAMAVIGLVVVAVVYPVLLLLAVGMKWQDSPVLYAVVAAVAATVAFLVTGADA